MSCDQLDFEKQQRINWNQSITTTKTTTTMAVIFGGRSALTVCLLTVLVLSSLLWEVADGGKGRRRSGRRRKRGNDKCSTSSVAEYKLTFYGAWSKEKFPRMYPRYRPPAQWSKLVGESGRTLCLPTVLSISPTVESLSQSLPPPHSPQTVV